MTTTFGVTSDEVGLMTTFNFQRSPTHNPMQLAPGRSQFKTEPGTHNEKVCVTLAIVTIIHATKFLKVGDVQLQVILPRFTKCQQNVATEVTRPRIACWEWITRRGPCLAPACWLWSLQRLSSVLLGTRWQYLCGTARHRQIGPTITTIRG